MPFGKYRKGQDNDKGNYEPLCKVPATVYRARGNVLSCVSIPASNALRNARVVAAFRECEDETVRLRIEPDEHCDMEDLKGDTFNRKANPDIQESRMAQEEKKFEESVERDGVVGVIGEYLDPITGEWEHADSCWGFTGYSDAADPFQNDYAVDIMNQTLDALSIDSQIKRVEDRMNVVAKEWGKLNALFVKLCAQKNGGAA